MKLAELREAFFKENMSPDEIVIRIAEANIKKFIDKKYVDMYVDNAVYVVDEGMLQMDVYVRAKKPSTSIASLADDEDEALTKRLTAIAEKNREKALKSMVKAQWEMVKVYKSIPAVNFTGVYMTKTMFPADEIKESDMLTHGVPTFFFKLTSDSDMSEWNGKVLSGD